MSKFKIIKGEGIDAELEKSEHKPTTFLVKSVVEHLEAVIKTIVELEAKIGLEKAMLTNIKGKHPKVITMKESDRQAAYLYMKSKLALLPAEEKLVELNKSLEDYRKEIKEVDEQTGINIENLCQKNEK